MSYFTDFAENISAGGNVIRRYQQMTKDGEKGGIMYYLQDEAIKTLNEVFGNGAFSGHQVRPNGGQVKMVKLAIAIIKMTEEEAEEWVKKSAKEAEAQEKNREAVEKIRKLEYRDEVEGE